jgi:CDP-glucose 4,6-dehydratase
VAVGTGSLEDLAVSDAAFWAGKRVFVTGHTGFKGSWLCAWLHRLRASVTGYSLEAPPTQPSLYESARIGDAVATVAGDVRDFESLGKAVASAMPEIVIHMAAQPLVRLSYIDPVGTFATNIMGTVNVLEAVRQLGGVRAVVIVTSDKCYQNNEWPWGYREIDPMGGHDPYSASKGCAELVAAAFRSSFFGPKLESVHGCAVASARAGNVIGGGDWAPDRLVPDLIRGFMNGSPVRIRRPYAIRPWQHVLEPLSGYLGLARELYTHGPAYAEAWNFGPRDDDARPVSWIAERLAHHWGGHVEWTLDTDSHPHEAAYLRLDWSKARTRLRWQPRWGLDTALERSVRWYRAYHRQVDTDCLRQLLLDDIEAYEAHVVRDA